MKELLYLIISLLLFLTSVQAESGKAAVKWQPVSGASFYQIYTAPTARGPWTLAGETNGVTWNFTNIYSGSFVRVESGQMVSTNPTAFLGAFSQLQFQSLPEATNGPVIVTPPPNPPGPNSELVVNGDFEQKLTNWVATGNCFTDHIGPWGTSGTSSDMTMALVFNGGDNVPNAVVSQTIPTKAGTKYALNYLVGISGLATQQQLNLTVMGNTNLLTQVISAVGPGDFVGFRWQASGQVFTADSSSIVLRIEDKSPTTRSVDIALDNISIRALP